MSAAPSAGTHSMFVRVQGGDRATLLSLASALHRRGVEVVDANLCRLEAEHLQFRATIAATDQQARTVESTVRGLVDVVEVEVAMLGVGEPHP